MPTKAKTAVCPVCRAKVKLPCVACAARAAMKKAGAHPSGLEAPAKDMAVDLSQAPEGADDRLAESRAKDLAERAAIVRVIWTAEDSIGQRAISPVRPVMSGWSGKRFW